MNSFYMQQALALARQGESLASPNPIVGAVIVQGDEVVGRGFHTYEGVKHAEILALEQAGGKARGASIYVTLEPCSHEGRTGPCADALIAAGIRKVFAASQDPNPLVSGGGFRKLVDAGIEVALVPEFRDEAEKLNEPFFHFMRTGRPLVTLKAAVTLDGKIAAPEDNTGWITSEVARAHVQQLRHGSDVMLTGIGTVLADNPLLTDRSGRPRSRPLLRVVLDSQLRIDLNSRMVQQTNGDLIVVTTSASSPDRRHALEEMGVEVRVFDGPGGRVDIRDTIRLLSERKYLSVMVEAGSKLNWSVLEAGVADKIFFYYAPKILGGMHSLPVAGGSGKRSRLDAIVLERTQVHVIPPDEFAVEAYIKKG